MKIIENKQSKEFRYFNNMILSCYEMLIHSAMSKFDFPIDRKFETM